MNIQVIQGDTFEEIFGVDKLRRFYDISPEIQFDCQPNYIHFASVEDKLVGFPGLGTHPEQDPTAIQFIKQLKGKVFQTVRMVIPPYFQMICLERFYNKIKDTPPEDTSAIILKDDCYKGYCSHELILELCSFVRNAQEEDLLRGERLGMSLDPCGGACQDDPQALGEPCVWFPLSVKRSITQQDHLGKMKHNPIVFYISYADICKREKAKNRIESLLPEVKKYQSAVFAIPTKLPNRGVCYFLIPNVKEYHLNHHPTGVKHILKHWIERINDYDSDQDQLFGTICDEQIYSVDAWNAFVCKQVVIPEKPSDP
ncbi:MAG: hypothetical protein AAF587_12830 [Bacteroidota bacterium]